MEKLRLFADILTEMRVKSWLKNLFVLTPIVFSLELFETDKLIRALILTVSFCMISSAVYAFNDIKDIEKDRNHSVKKNRPLAAGRISVTCAWIMIAVLAFGGLLLAFAVDLTALSFILLYILINILYTGWLKKKAVVDCFCIATGFVLRVLTGGTVVEGGVSDWMFLTVISFSLFMAFGKRRGELLTHSDRDTRTVLDSYEIPFLNGSVFMCAGLTMVFYSLWCLSQGDHLVYTVPVIMFIVIRYLTIVFSGLSDGDPTTVILSDKTILVACGVCGLVLLAILYAPLML